MRGESEREKFLFDFNSEFKLCPFRHHSWIKIYPELRLIVVFISKYRLLGDYHSILPWGVTLLRGVSKDRDAYIKLGRMYNTKIN
ncbi:hypothetical protein CSQ80_11075 [Cyanobacterium aponinum IPPAS B-1201]|nr:hypothetical protein CSQ80_11075 [Cyanobacterium aponinum IPPAS B-1201]